MYEELTTIEEADGKTVQSGGITISILLNQMIIAFTDGTFLAFGIDQGREDDSFFRRGLDFEDFGSERLVESGIISREEFQQMKALRREALRRGREAAERTQYARLKAKFEGGKS